MTDGHCFISYSHADGLDFVKKLIIELEGGYPPIPVWFEKRDIVADKDDWDDQIAKAIQQCKCLIYVMSQDSTADHSNCKDEWAWALKYKKPVLCLWIDNKAEDQFRLNSRQKIDFITDFNAGLGKLRKSIAHLDSPAGQLEELNHRLADANRDLRRASEEKKALIQSDIDELKKQIEAQQKIVNDPEAAKRETEQKIQNGLERERKPEKPLAAFQSSKFINQPPGVAQNYFQDRLMETEQAILFLKNEAQRVLTVVGRGGAGKTAMTCRLLKFVENGGLPDDYDKKHDKVDIDGIVYLSEAGSRKVNFANLFEDLCKLLPAARAEKLSALYREPQTSTESKTVQLLAAFQGLKQVIVLLDNFENVVDAEKGQVRDAELDEALRAFLHAPHHPVKIIITTRVSARELDAFEPARQRLLPLDTGLQPEYAREAFVLMDEGNLVGIKNAGADLLNLAVTRTLGLPRALEALYAALRTDRFTTLQELLDLPILPEQVVQAYVGEAFNRLDTNAQKVMQALAVYNRPVTPAAVDYLLAPHLPAIDSAPILQRLANMHFARKESGRFYLHPVDRDFAFKLIPDDVMRNAENVKDDSHESRFTQHDLLTLAADYFAAARKPRAEWKKLEDLSAQLAEFDLRCAAGDYDMAASVLLEIGSNYLFRWGHHRLIIDLHLRVKDNLIDKILIAGNLIALGNTHSEIGKIEEAVRFEKEGLEFSRKTGDKADEGVFLGNLGDEYAILGDARKAIEYSEQALIISRTLGDSQNECAWLVNLGNNYVALSNYQKAKTLLLEALPIADSIQRKDAPILVRWELAKAYLFQNDLVNALDTIETALEYDVPQYNHNASALHGIITLRLGDEVAARGAFVRAIGQADEILSKTAEYYSALDAKGLAICGLVLCDGKGDPSMTAETKDGKIVPSDKTTDRAGRVAPTLEDAIETFRKARKIAPHAGIVKSVLRLFDELMKCEGGEILKDVRNAVEGKE